MDPAAQVIAILRADPIRWHLLGVVGALNLPDGWVGAGFVRNAVWDHRHGWPCAPPSGDVDVIWHDPNCLDAAQDRKLEAALRMIEPAVVWSVKNQARMHVRNQDPPYPSTTEAMRFWPETATAVAARRVGENGCEIAAPYGLCDLMDVVLRPTPCFTGTKRHIYEERVRSKRWMDRWPLLREAE